MNYIGVDIGSTSAKTVVLDEEENIVHSFVKPTGWSSVDTAEAIRKELLEREIDPGLLPCVATGYGRVAVPFADKTVTEITCHGRGALALYGHSNMTVVDIGGQDTKIIRLEDGAVKDFVMNDKCSAGTGRFLEVMAGILELSPDELCELARSGGGTIISSMCTVFAESEVVSLIGRGEKKENIAYAVVDSIVTKVISQAGRLERNGQKVCLTGGLCSCSYMQDALGAALRTDVITSPEGRYAGAVGAAVSAAFMGVKP